MAAPILCSTYDRTIKRFFQLSVTFLEMTENVCSSSSNPSKEIPSSHCCRSCSSVFVPSQQSMTISLAYSLILMTIMTLYTRLDDYQEPTHSSWWLSRADTPIFMTINSRHTQTDDFFVATFKKNVGNLMTRVEEKSPKSSIICSVWFLTDGLSRFILFFGF